MPLSDASVLKVYVSSGLGNCNIGAEANIAFKVVKAYSCDSLHSTCLDFPFFNKSDIGAAMAEKFGINLP